MVAPPQAPRRMWIAGCQRFCIGLVVLVGVIALPAPIGAQADPYTPPSVGATDPDLPALFECPEAPLPTESEDPVVAELREARREGAAICLAHDSMLREVARRQWWLVAELSRLHDAVAKEATAVGAVEGLATLHDDLSKVDGLAVRIAAQDDPLLVSVPAGVEVANPPDVAAVEAAVVQGTETSNQNLWGIAGLACSAIFLIAFWRLVRP